ncbi:sulfotransferase domain-containing protein [Sphingopyxis fribergensis]
MSGRHKPAAASGILWIASYPKSGNTWTRAFLNNVLKILDGQDDGTPQDINHIDEYTIWDLSAKRYERHLGKSAKDVDRAQIARVRPMVQAEMAGQADGLAIVKTHNALVEDRGHPSINFAVTAGAIYIVRNPLDVAVSFAAHMGSSIEQAIERMGTDDLETGVTDANIYEIYGSWSQHVESWTRRPHDAIHIMRYEDMLSAPLPVFQRLTQHLQLPASRRQVAKAIDRSSFTELQRQEDMSGFRAKPDTAQRFFRSGTAGNWRHALGPMQVRAILLRHAAQMERFGYMTDELRALM